MSNSDNLFKGLVGRAITEGINSSDEKNKAAEVRLILSLIGILFFVGVEAVKVVFRKNFGVKGINMFQLVICFICFLGIGILFMVHSLYGKEVLLAKEMGVTASSYLIMGACYVILAFYVLKKGISERTKAKYNNVPPYFTGESGLLNVLSDKGWSQSKIQYLGEPLYTLILGIILIFYNPLAAIPFIFCALSVWANVIMEFVFAPPIQSQMNNQSQFHQPQQPTKTGKASTDF